MDHASRTKRLNKRGFSSFCQWQFQKFPHRDISPPFVWAKLSKLLRVATRRNKGHKWQLDWFRHAQPGRHAVHISWAIRSCLKGKHPPDVLRASPTLLFNDSGDSHTSLQGREFVLIFHKSSKAARSRRRSKFSKGMDETIAVVRTYL